MSWSCRPKAPPNRPDRICGILASGDYVYDKDWNVHLEVDEAETQRRWELVQAYNRANGYDS